jgi:membrane associated rhomboid family serine protease
MYYQQNPFNDAKQFFLQNSILNRLIVINVAFFVIVNIINLFFWLFKADMSTSGLPGTSLVTYYLSVPANPASLLMRPWTIFTYMFLQENFFHLFFNMLVLFFGGRIFLEYLDGTKLLRTYIFGGLAGAGFYILAFNIFPVFKESIAYSVALGSSASVLAILIAIATYVPEYSVILLFIGRVKLKYLALIIVLIDILSISKGNAGGHIAHLGGALWGYLFITQMKAGRKLSFNFKKVKFKKFFKFFTGSEKKPKYDPVTGKGRPLTDEEFNTIKNIHQQRIDKILEKISKSGYSSLSKEEKELLFNSSSKK